MHLPGQRQVRERVRGSLPARMLEFPGLHGSLRRELQRHVFGAWPLRLSTWQRIVRRLLGGSELRRDVLRNVSGHLVGSW